MPATNLEASNIILGKLPNNKTDNEKSLILISTSFDLSLCKIGIIYCFAKVSTPIILLITTPITLKNNARGYSTRVDTSKFKVIPNE